MVSNHNCQVLGHVAVVFRAHRDGQLLQKDARNHLESGWVGGVDENYKANKIKFYHLHHYNHVAIILRKCVIIIIGE